MAQHVGAYNVRTLDSWRFRSQLHPNICQPNFVVSFGDPGSFKDGVLIPMECMMSKLKHLKTDMVEVCRQKSVVDSIYSSGLHKEKR